MAAVLGAFVPDTAVRWRGVVAGDVAGRVGVAAEARALAGRLERAGAAVRDAEARAARGDEGAARWLANALPRLLSSCCDADVPGGDVAADVRSLNRKLQVILKEKNRLQLRSFLGDHHAAPVRAAPRLRRSQGTRAPGSGIVGSRIEDDAAGLVRQLTEAGGQAGCAVVAIIGPDGIGKTTLATKVYGSERVRRSFGARSWVRVPREYTEAGLLSQVIDSFGGDTTGGESFADLERTLARLVGKRRFLLVLDDVRHGGVWEDVLRRPLEGAGRGSKVLATARHGSIARELGTGHIHRVKRLGADDGWLLLRAAARVVDEAAAAELKDVGERVAEKCGGVPLAIKAVAGVLRTRQASAGEWAEVLASPAWLVKGLPEDAMKPLYLCYDDLPCHLKQCFLYCSLFPSDYAMDRRVLVHQWIAEGFVQIRADAGVEEVAEEYYDELVRRHLLQPEEEDEHGVAARCTVHDMLRALAQLLAQSEGMTGDSYRLLVDSDASFAPRRVSFPRRNLSVIPEKILKLEGLRTLFLQKNPLTIEGSTFTRLEHLKVLDLSETAVELIPDNLGNLVYLRFLNLSHTRIQAIPESIGNLWSLKFLLLRGCKSLHALPKGIENLRGLRDLDLAGTVIDDAAFRVGHLRSLTALQCFAVTSKEARAAQDRSGWPLDELRNVSQLRTLHIQKLEKAAGRSEATEMSLAAKKGLRELVLSCSGTVKPLQTPELVRKIEDIFEEMNPPLFLESLKLVNYFGTRFPRWLSVTFLPNLRDLDIVGCNFCQSFPPLGRLPELRSLYIADSPALKDIGVEFMGTNHPHQVPFPKLENLHLQGLQQLTTWRDIEPGALPSLQVLQLETCPKLQHLPAGLIHVTSLTVLRIADMASLQAVDDIATLRELSAWNTPSLKRISNLPSLEDINMCHCPVLEIVENVDGVQTVHIFDYDLQEMPRWIEAHASKLQSLNFTSTVGLLKRCLVDGPDWPVIKDIKEVHGYSTGSSYIYYTRSPYVFESDVNAEDNLDAKENSADPDNVDDVSVSSSGTGYLEIRGFFDSKAVESGAIRTEDSVYGRDMERSMPRFTCRHLHKIAEVVPDDDEDDDEADSAVLFPTDPTRGATVLERGHPAVTDVHTNNDNLGSLSKETTHESRAITNDGTHDTIGRSFLIRRRGLVTVNDVPSDAGIDADTYVAKSAASVGRNLVREGSRAISITEINQALNFSTVQSKEHTSKKGEDIAADVNIAEDISVAHSKKVRFKKGKDFAETTTATISSSNMVIQKQIKNQTANLANGSADATPMPENPSREEASKKSTGVIGSSLIHEASHKVSVTATTQGLDATSLCSKQQPPDKGEEGFVAPCAAGAVDQKEDSNISSPVKLNDEECKAISATETNCDSGSRKLPTSLAFRNQQTHKMQQTVFAYPRDDINASTKELLGMGSGIPKEVSSKCAVGLVKDSSVEAAKSIVPSMSGTMRTISHAIDVTEAPMIPEANTASRFPPSALVSHGGTRDDAPCSIDAKEDGDSHQAPKVYTAIWADTDTDTLRARLLDSMRHLRTMASRRRHRRRKRGSKSKWSIGPAVVAVLLLVSVVQLLFILWLCRRLPNKPDRM
ncbi:putative disease resistance protein RGA3 [Panicum miliaceum]|uniref:Disease resistance protein RGA3 n=1 Tax=Panicum miliaceum TaxID=4540 RepID=A0A3L6TIS7_PANMI|nr:putative disease resistance protein RGA3 [Panicum miliaceum]